MVREYPRHVEALPRREHRPASRSPIDEDRARTAGGSTTRGAAARHRDATGSTAREMTVRTNFVDAASPCSTARPPSSPLPRTATRAARGARSCCPPHWRRGAARSLRRRTPGGRARFRRRGLRHPGRLADLRRQRPRSTASRSTAGRTCWSTRARAASGTARARPPTSSGSCASRPPSGARVPYPRYVFFNLLTGGGRRPGAPRLDGADEQPLEDAHAARATSTGWAWSSHELFHAWNVQAAAPRRARPLRLRERGLHARASGWPRGSPRTTTTCWSTAPASSTRDEYLKTSERRHRDARRRTPGRRGADARGRPRSTPGSSTTGGTRTSPTRGISYYTKGAVVAFLLDARIRRATDGQRSLDDVLRLAWRRYLGRARLPAGGAAAPCLEEVAGIDLEPLAGPRR